MPGARRSGQPVWPRIGPLAGLLAVVAGLVAGCGGQRDETAIGAGSATAIHTTARAGSTAGPAGSDTAGRPSGADTAGQPSGGASDPSAPPTPHRHRNRIIDWITDLAPLGEGASGGAEEAWVSFVDGSCNGPVTTPIERLPDPVRTVYLAGNAACQAAFHDRPDQWAVAERRIGAAETHVADLDCTEAAVLRVTRALIDIHRQDPTARLSRGRATGDKYGTCPTLTSVQPSHGPAAGGYQVVLTGTHLPVRPTIVFWIDEPNSVQITEVRRLAVSNAAGTRTTVVMPPGTPGGSAAMYVRGYPYLVQGQPTFGYDRPDRPAAVPSRTASATPGAGPTGEPAPPTSTGPPAAVATTPTGS